MVRVIIGDEHDIDRVEAWCQRLGIDAYFKPLWCGGSVCGYETTVADDDGFTMRLAWGYGPTML